MEVLLILTVGAVNVLCFFIGAKVGQTVAKGETIMVPADMPDFYLVPRDSETVLLEAVTRPEEIVDGYIDPETEAFLEGEDYEGLEDGLMEEDDEDMEDHGPAGASPLGFFR